MGFFKKMLWMKIAFKTSKLYNEGKYEEALKVGEEALQKSESIFGEKHINTNRALYNLAAVCTALEQYEKAEKYALRALSITEENKGKEDKNIVDDLRNLLNIYEKWGKEEQGKKIKERIENTNL